MVLLCFVPFLLHVLLLNLLFLYSISTAELYFKTDGNQSFFHSSSNFLGKQFCFCGKIIMKVIYI